MSHPFNGSYMLLKSRKSFHISGVQVNKPKLKLVTGSETPRVDSVLDAYPVKYSYQYAKELEFIAKQLELELNNKPTNHTSDVEHKLRKAIEQVKILENIVERYREKEFNTGKIKGFKFNDIPHHKRYEHLSNDDVMEKLRSLGVGNRKKT